MKRFILIAVSLLFSAHNVAAKEYNVVADDASREYQLCVRAATNDMSLTDIAKSVGVNINALDRRVQCNGIAISEFVRQFNIENNRSGNELTNDEYLSPVRHANNDGKLCVIAASGNIKKLKHATRIQGLSVKSFVKYNRCNNQSVSDFVSQFGDKKAAIELQKYI